MKCVESNRQVTFTSFERFAMFVTTPVMVSTCKSNWMLTFQDQGLDMIAEGLDTLKDMAHDMNEVRCFLVLLNFDVFHHVAACVFVIIFNACHLYDVNRNWIDKFP